MGGEDGTSTQFPSGLTVGATWDVDLAKRWGGAMGREFAGKGANVQLGPGMNVARVPQCGRNFEYISGEDPVLGATLVGPVIEGIQGEGVIANAKHFVNNNQETQRMLVNEVVDERTQFELYMPPFQAAIESGVLSAMCSYNRLTTPATGETAYACQHHESLTVDLKGRLGFEGWVMSDWTGTKSTVQAATAGLDQEMPAGLFFGAALKRAVVNGEVDEAIVDDKVLRILSAMFTIGLFDNTTDFGDVTNNVTCDEHRALAQELSAAATVLAKNDGQALPFKPDAMNNILVVGDAAHNAPVTGGAGSGQVVPSRVVTPFEGVRARVGDTAVVSYLPTPAPGDDAAAAALTAAAAAADATLVFVGITSGEGSDRETLALAAAEDAMVELVAAANPAVSVVVVACPGAVLTPWAASVDAVLYNFMPGQEVGGAIASVLFGDVNPSARLPVTMPNEDNEIEFTQEQYPGTGLILTANYTEQLLIGHRWYDANSKIPQFPFGHGLSYTTFDYTPACAAAFDEGTGVTTVTFDLSNSGSMAGSEVAQLYVEMPEGLAEPIRQLKAFRKLALGAGESAVVKFELSMRDLSVWDETAHEWTQDGVLGHKITMHVGASSRDLRSECTVTLS